VLAAGCRVMVCCGLTEARSRSRLAGIASFPLASTGSSTCTVVDLEAMERSGHAANFLVTIVRFVPAARARVALHMLLLGLWRVDGV
jgi:hypothetical protein